MPHLSFIDCVRPVTVAVAGLIGAGLLVGTVQGDDFDAPDTITLNGVVRDFKERTAPGGHPDFELRPNGGFAHYCGNVSPNLGSNGKPVFVGNGWKVSSQWKNSAGKNICYLLYNPSLGDIKGSKGAADNGAITSASSFNSWFNDVPGVNMSKVLPLTLHRQANGSYVFDSQVHEPFKSLGGFFPIENELFGNPGGSPNRNFHFTYELHTEFTYDADGAQVFSFRGDDDVWVYIDGKLVIDLGGVHEAIEQVVDLNRLGLVDGETYTLDFFFAERHRTQSNFKITTNLRLASVPLPTISAQFD